jgi:hypothetical protein
MLPKTQCHPPLSLLPCMLLLLLLLPTSPHFPTAPYPIHVLTRPALCIRCRHWRLCPRFLPGLRRQQPFLALRPQPARGCFSALSRICTRSRDECNGHGNVYRGHRGPLFLCFQPLRSVLCPTNRTLRPLPLGKCSEHCKEQHQSGKRESYHG